MAKVTSVFPIPGFSKRRCVYICAKLDGEEKCKTGTFSKNVKRCLFFENLCEKIDANGKYCLFRLIRLSTKINSMKIKCTRH
jgi:hypothetical protein